MAPTQLHVLRYEHIAIAAQCRFCCRQNIGMGAQHFGLDMTIFWQVCHLAVCMTQLGLSHM